MIAEALKRRIERIFRARGHVYAFDSTMIDLCLSVFEWAKFRKHKGGTAMHTLYDVEAEVPAFVHITPANIHDTKAMSVIPMNVVCDICFPTVKRVNDLQLRIYDNRV